MAQFYTDVSILESNIEIKKNDLELLLEGDDDLKSGNYEYQNGSYYYQMYNYLQENQNYCSIGPSNAQNVSVHLNPYQHHNFAGNEYETQMNNQQCSMNSSSNNSSYNAHILSNRKPYQYNHQLNNDDIAQIRAFQQCQEQDISTNMNRVVGRKNFQKKTSNCTHIDAFTESTKSVGQNRTYSNFFQTLVKETDISLSALGIHLYKPNPSLFKSLFIKFKNCCFIMNQLKKERHDIERDLYKKGSTAFKNDIVYEISDNNIRNYLEYIIQAVTEEYNIVKNILTHMEDFCTTILQMKRNHSEIILKEFGESIEKVKILLLLKSFSQQNTDIVDDDLNVLIMHMDDLILSIKYSQTYLWCLKTSILYAANHRNRDTNIGS